MVHETPLTAAEIYEQITGGHGPGSLTNAREAAQQLTRLLEDLAAAVRATADTGLGWQGGAGERAALLTRPLSQAAETDSALLRDTDRAVTDQITAFGTVRDSVVPVPPQPPAPTKEDLIVDLLGGNSFEAKLDGYERDAWHNVAAFRSYHQASTANGDTVPVHYTPLRGEGIEITRVEEHERAADPGTGPAASGTADTESSASPDSRAPSSPSAVDPGQPEVPASTDRPDGTQAAASHTSSPVVTNPSHEQQQPGRPTAPAPPAQHTGSPASAPAVGGAPPRPAPRTDAPGRTPTTPRTGSPPPPGRGSGAGAVGQPAASRGGTASPAGTTGAAPRGAAGIPAAGATRGAGEDKDRRRPDYLREADPDDTFRDPLPTAAPPVIGERPSR
ncbi:PPE domain-containing protein [Saccharomonospora piscinae]|uniref:PPE domain-containing protein n=1 Tax=Saccharomonospora piscinae TaxID=687388 RepID=UPI000463598F|nr:PPE domain-containing protein [Saccharomonospora piscinae]